MAFANVSMVMFSKAVTSFAAAIIVSDILVPVSPSGTGKTFNSLINSFFASMFAAPAKNISESISALIVLVAKIRSSLTNQSLLRLQRIY